MRKFFSISKSWRIGFDETGRLNNAVSAFKIENGKETILDHPRPRLFISMAMAEV